MERRHWTYVILAGLVALGVFCGGVAAVVSATSGSESAPKGQVKVAVLEIHGILEKADDDLKTLRKIRDDNDLKAVVIRVDSPGGAVGPAQELHDAIARTAKVKPVVVSMANVAASGGYYLSVAATKIYADPGTLTASIGVIAEIPEVDQLMSVAKVQMNVYRSGKLKDVGSPFRPPNDDDRRLMQGVIDDTYDQFLHAVADGRHLKVEDVKPWADGRVLTGRQAKAHGLIDELGGLEDAAHAAVALANLTGEPDLVYPGKDFKLTLQEMLAEESRATVTGMRSALTGAGLGGLYFLSNLGAR